MKRPGAATLATLAVTLFVGCRGGDTPEAVVTSDGLAVVDAWVRPTPAGADEAAFYVSIRNDDAPATSVLGASSPACMVILPHATAFDDDIASMGAALDDQLVLATGSEIVMEPNGLHLMCLGLVDPLVAGDAVPVSIELRDRAPIEVDAAVEQR